MAVQRNHDVIIVGAGPSGIQCALSLHRFDFDIVTVARRSPFGLRRIIDVPEDEADISLRVSADLARKNVDEFIARRIPLVWGSAKTIQWSGGLWEVNTEDILLRGKRVILAVGAPTEGRFGIDLSDLEELETDDEGRIVLDDAYNTLYRGLHAVGEAASGYVRTLSCALGTGDGVARAVASRILKERAARATEIKAVA